MWMLRNSDLLMNGGWLSDLTFNADEEDECLVVYYGCDIRDWDFGPEVCKALAVITGENLGEDTTAWLTWWKCQPEYRGQSK